MKPNLARYSSYYASRMSWKRQYRIWDVMWAIRQKEYPATVSVSSLLGRGPWVVGLIGTPIRPAPHHLGRLDIYYIQRFPWRSFTPVSTNLLAIRTWGMGIRHG